MPLTPRQSIAFCGFLDQIARQLYNNNAACEAEAIWRSCIPHCRELLVKDPYAPLNYEWLARALHNQASCLFAMQRYEEALNVGSEAAELHRGLFPIDTRKHHLALMHWPNQIYISYGPDL